MGWRFRSENPENRIIKKTCLSCASRQVLIQTEKLQERIC